MPAITFGGMNSGLPPDLVERLVEAERLPVKKMAEQKGKSEERLKLVSDLETKISAIRGSLGELASARGFADIKVLSGDPNIVQGIVDPALSQPGSWNIEVVKLAEKAAAITNGFPDKDKTEIGVGYFKFKTADGYREVYINGDNNTLEGAAQAINNAKLGVRASVINDRKEKDSPFKLVIAADAVGSDNTVEYPTLYFLDGDQDIFFDSEKEASNGIVKVDGFEFEIADNTLKDMIPGVTLELKQAAPGRSVNVTVKEDLEVVSGKIKSFVDAMNGVLGFIQQQNKLDKSTDTTKTLGGDGLIRSIEQRLRQMVLTPQYGVKGTIRNLNQMGIQFNRAGTLDYDEKKFNAVLAQNPEAVHSFFVGDNMNTGFVPTVRREIGTMLNSAFGPLSNRKRGLQQKIDQIDQRIETKERQLVRREEQLRNKFAKLEETLGRIKGQGQAMAAIQSGGGGGG
ncbi:MAG: flagellar filament capping protein FliD [Bdellovibrionaceae bacterium]|nr:flagellar filament capping protein FliD [Pseudobdellovibrionaceae bacterium]